MDPDAVSRVVDRLLGEIELVTSLGDAALIAWAAAAAGRDTRRAWRRVVELDAVTQPHAVVDLAWTLAATCIDADASPDGLREVGGRPDVDPARREHRQRLRRDAAFQR